MRWKKTLTALPTNDFAIAIEKDGEVTDVFGIATGLND